MTNGEPQPAEPSGDRKKQPTGLMQFTGTGGSRRVLLITLAVCLCLVAAGIAIAVLSSGGGTSPGLTAGADRSPAATGAAPPLSPATAPATTGPRVTSHGSGKSALHWPPSLKRQMLRWEAGPGGKALAAVQEQLGTALQAAGVKLYIPARQACVRLASGVAAAETGPPIPDLAMRRLYTRALAGLSRAAAECQEAIKVDNGSDESVSSHQNQALLNRARAELGNMSNKLYKATGAIQSVLG